MGVMKTEQTPAYASQCQEQRQWIKIEGIKTAETVILQKNRVLYDHILIIFFGIIFMCMFFLTYFSPDILSGSVVTGHRVMALS